jgi:hypothetical protein
MTDADESALVRHFFGNQTANHSAQAQSVTLFGQLPRFLYLAGQEANCDWLFKAVY